MFNVRWNHSKDPKASPNSNFSASVNFGSSDYFRESVNQLNSPNFLNAQVNGISPVEGALILFPSFLDHSVNENKSKSLNKTYFQKNNAADVLSFPLYKNIDSILSLNPKNEEDLGDMFINRKIIKNHSEIYGKSFVEELQFIIIHGLLHLVGYSHKNEIKLRKMEDELMKMVWNEY